MWWRLRTHLAEMNPGADPARSDTARPPLSPGPHGSGRLALRHRTSAATAIATAHAAALLIPLGALTLATDARTRVVRFKICPVMLVGSAILLLVASFQ